jgi:hypothetical protein
VSNTKRNRGLGGILVLIGAILMIVAMFTAWYVYTESFTFDGATEKGTFSFFPTYSASYNGSTQTATSCSGSSDCPSSTTTDSSYSAGNLNHTGQIAVTGWYLILGGFITGILGAILALGSRSKQGWVKPALALSVIALLLALVTPVIYLVALPGAVKADTPSMETSNASGPWSSFFGSSSVSGASTTWGAGIGWYLAFIAFVLFLIGVILLAKSRAPAPEEASGMMAPAQPEMGAPTGDTSTYGAPPPAPPTS